MGARKLTVGVGLRSAHYDRVLDSRPAVPWFEATSENYMGPRGGSGGRPLEMLERVRADYPIHLHGVSLNIGSTDPLDIGYLERLKALADRIRPETVSDHFCWTGSGGRNTHDLLPIPFTEEAVRHVAGRVQRVQDALGRRILLENVSSYVAFEHADMSEWDFIAEVAGRADCEILLDVNNVHVSASNHGFDALDFLEGLPAERVGYMHLGGYSDQGEILIDTHDHPVSEPVWALYEKAVRRFGAVPAIIEWDGSLPTLERLVDEAERATLVQEKARDLASAR
jgi:uncharacterized protein (UPF0276 family)